MKEEDQRKTQPTENQKGQEEDPFWQYDEAMGEVIFFGEKSTVRLQAHIAEEPYSLATEGKELVPIADRRSKRIYVMARPYLLEPDYRLTFGLYPQPTQEGALGEVVSADWSGMKQRVVGQAQAWLYPSVRTLVLWECYPFELYRDQDPRSDQALQALWTGFEEFLLRRFEGQVEHLVTPSWEPLYQQGEWQQFLTGLGYQPMSEQAFGKQVGGVTKS